MVNLTSLKYRETGGTGIHKEGFPGIQGKHNWAYQIYVTVFDPDLVTAMSSFSIKMSKNFHCPIYFIICYIDHFCFNDVSSNLISEMETL